MEHLSHTKRQIDRRGRRMDSWTDLQQQHLSVYFQVYCKGNQSPSGSHGDFTIFWQGLLPPFARGDDFMCHVLFFQECEGTNPVVIKHQHKTCQASGVSRWNIWLFFGGLKAVIIPGCLRCLCFARSKLDVSRRRSTKLTFRKAPHRKKP